MFGVLKFKRQRNYFIVKATMEIENIDTEEKAKDSLKLTYENGKNGTIFLALITAILLILLPQFKSMLIAIAGIFLIWIWASIHNGRKHIMRFIDEEIHGNKPVGKN